MVDDPPESFGLPPDLVSEFVDEGLCTLDEHFTGKLKATAARNGIPAAEAAPLIESARLGETKRHLVATALPHALREHGIDPNLSPTACIAAVFLVWGIAQLRTANALGKRVETSDRPRVETSSPATPT